MNNRVGLAIAGVIAVIAIIFALIQSGNLSQSTTQLSALQTTATVQALAYVNQGTAAVATLNAASTTAADTQQKALSDAANTAATAQAKALADAAQAASTLQAQVVAAANAAAATEELNARKEVANAAATAQASAVSAAQNAAATEKAHVIATGQAQTTATLGAVVNAAASAQAEAITQAQNAAATEKAKVIATGQAQATATLGAVVNAAASAQANTLGTVEAQATATLSAVIAKAATDSAQLEAHYQSTAIAVETQIASINAELETAQFKPTATAIVPTAAPTEQATRSLPTLVATIPADIGTPTSVPTDQAAAVPEGWKRFIGKGVAIQLPNTFIGSELGSDPTAFAKMLRGLGPDFEAAASLFENNPEILAFVAINKGSSDTDLAANVIIVSIPLPSSIPMNTMLDATIQQLPSGSKVLERSIVQLGDYEAGRMILETHVGAIISTQLQYYIIANNALYLVGFTGKPDQFDSQVPLFEKSMKTFEILAKPGI